MSQLLRYYMGEIEVSREMPDAEEFVLPDVRWGEPWTMFTAAYWLSQVWMSGLDQQSSSPYRANGSLHEEIVFCMLGGNGITSELATAAFEACRNSELITRLETTAAAWSEVLQQPLQLNGRSHRYRYPNQKAGYLAGAMAFLRRYPLAASGGKELRDSLLKIHGIGPKTAGWIVRNYLDTDDVAILDVHLVRAGLLCDLFSPSHRVQRDYFAMEARFIEFCRVLEVRPAILDCLIWDQMRNLGSVALDALKNKLGRARSEVFTNHSVKMRMRLTGED